MTRKALAWATVTLHVKQEVAADGFTHITIANTVTGGIKGTTEARTLDYTYREHEDHIFGSLRGRSRWLDPSSPSAQPNPAFPEEGIMDGYLMDGWLEEGEGAGPGGESKVQSTSISNDKGWTADQIWGFAIVDGKRYHVRRVVVRKGNEVLKARLVYDWQGKK